MVVVHPFLEEEDLLVAEAPAADGDEKVYTFYHFHFDDVYIIISKGIGFYCLNGTSCRY